MVFIGVGGRGRHWIRRVVDHRDFEPAAIVDPAEKAHQAVAEEFGELELPAFESVEAAARKVEKVNGVNFFHDNNPTRADLGDIALESAKSEITDAGVVLRTLNNWATKEGVCMLEEQRDVAWRPGDQVHVLDVASTLISRVGDVTFAKDKHAFFGIRVADTIDVEDGGRVVNSRGQENEVGTMGQEADWVDYNGVVADQAVGVTLMHHPSNPRSPYFVRDYGTFLSNFTMNEPYVLRDGKSLLQRFRVLVHEDRAEEVDIVGYHAEFCAA